MFATATWKMAGIAIAKDVSDKLWQKMHISFALPRLNAFFAKANYFNGMLSPTE
jgi:hypothetical protein